MNSGRHESFCSGRHRRCVSDWVDAQHLVGGSSKRLQLCLGQLRSMATGNFLHWRVFFSFRKSGRSITAALDKIFPQTFFEGIDKGWKCGLVGVSITSVTLTLNINVNRNLISELDWTHHFGYGTNVLRLDTAYLRK